MTNTKILRGFIQKVWNEKDYDTLPLFLDDEYTIHLDSGDLWEGKQLNLSEFKKRLAFSFSSFPDICFDIKTAVEDDNHVAITWIMTGTNSGMIGDFPPTHKKIRANGFTIYHFNNGKICGHSQVFDRPSIMKQLGLMN